MSEALVLSSLPPGGGREFSSVSLVYVVDDERIFASTLAAVLQLNGFAGRFFFDPFEALDLLSPGLESR
jgi:FixJ family two-component response regulator